LSYACYVYIGNFSISDVMVGHCAIVNGSCDEERDHALELRNVYFILTMVLLKILKMEIKFFTQTR